MIDLVTELGGVWILGLLVEAVIVVGTDKATVFVVGSGSGDNQFCTLLL